MAWTTTATGGIAQAVSAYANTTQPVIRGTDVASTGASALAPRPSVATGFDRAPVGVGGGSSLAQAIAARDRAAMATAAEEKAPQNALETAVLSAAITSQNMQADGQISALHLDAMPKESDADKAAIAGLSWRGIINAGEQSMLDGLHEVRGVADNAGTTPNDLEGSLKSFTDRLGRNVERFDIWMNAIDTSIDGMHKAMLAEKDPNRLQAMLLATEGMMNAYRMVSKEREKQEALRRLIFLLLIGVYIPPELVAQLRAMGLGHIVDELVATLLHKGDVTPQLIACLRAAGLGHLIASEASLLEEQERDTAQRPRREQAELLHAVRQQQVDPGSPAQGTRPLPMNLR